MEYFVALTFSFLCVQVSTQDSVDFVAALQQACPYTNFCTRNASRVLQDVQDERQTPCCTDCSCTDDCWKRGNCCPDKNIEDGGLVSELEPCTDTIVKRSKFNGVRHGDLRYFVIGTCPVTEEDEILKQKCKGTLAETFADLIWVTDTKTNKIYNNKFCAECHGVRTYKQWNLKTSCTLFLFNENYSQNIQSFPDSCSLSVSAPNKKASENLCISPDISSCNETGLWHTKDSVTEKLCKVRPLLFLEETGTTVTVYRNIFCFKCNVPPESRIKDICFSDGNRRTSSSFMAILNIFEADISQKKRRCGVDEVEDPLKRICLQLHCPLSSFPWYGACERRSSKTNFMGINVKYRLRANRYKVKYGANDKEDYSITVLGEAIARDMYRNLGLEECSRCPEAMSKSNNDVIVGNARLPLFFNFMPYFYTYGSKCQEEDIANALSKLIGKELIVNIDEEEYVTFDIEEAEYTYVSEQNTSTVELPVLAAFCSVRIFHDYRDFHKCPMVKLDSTYYPTLMGRANTATKKSLVNSLFAKEGEPDGWSDQNNATLVCWEDYKKTVIRLTNVSWKSSSMKIIPIMTLVVFIILN